MVFALLITFNALTVRQQVALDTHVSNLGALKMIETIPQTSYLNSAILTLFIALPITSNALTVRQ